MTPDSLKLDAYIRVSRVGGRSGESFISPQVQRERTSSWAQAHGHTLTWHEPELDVSGGTMERPVFERIMERVRAGETDGVIVAKLDRFARTLVGALRTLEEFERCGAVLVSVADNIDLSTPVGRAFLRVLLVFAELERDRISESWEVATSNAINRGIHIAKFVPRGYEKGADKRLVLSAEAPSIREAFLMRAAHRTHTEIARMLNEQAPRPNGGRWTAPMVDRLIKMRVYVGEAFRGSTVNPQAHEGIVTPAEWQAAQLAPVRGATRSREPSLLSGIARCEECRYVLAPSVSAHSKRRVPNYRCRAVHTAGVCPSPASVKRSRLDEYVEAVWREQMARQAVSVQRDSAAIQGLSDVLSEAQDELAAFAVDTTARRLLGETYHAAIEARVRNVNQAQAELQRALASVPSFYDIESYDELSVQERRRILASSIDAVFLKRGHNRVPIEDRVTILWRGEGPNDLPRRGRDNGPIRPYAPLHAQLDARRSVELEVQQAESFQ